MKIARYSKDCKPTNLPAFLRRTRSNDNKGCFGGSMNYSGGQPGNRHHVLRRMWSKWTKNLLPWWQRKAHTDKKKGAAA
jgi:hypothetical protein